MTRHTTPSPPDPAAPGGPDGAADGWDDADDAPGGPGTPVRRAAVLGAGTMGLGIACVLHLGGVDVTLCDADAAGTAAAADRLRERVARQVDAGLLPASAADRAGSVLTCHPARDAVTGVDLLVEAVPEDVEVKRDLLAEVSPAAPDHAVIATNTSSIPVEDLAGAVADPARFLGMHWFVPPEWVPGVEIVVGPQTGAAAVATCRTLLRRLGKAPAVVRSAPGFVANRLQMALFAEAVACVADGVATPDQVDEVVRGTFGFRLPHFGPFEIADMAGLDVYAAIFATLERQLGPRFAPPAALADLVRRGRLGVKSGGGFGDHDDERTARLLAARDGRYAAFARWLAGQPPLP